MRITAILWTDDVGNDAVASFDFDHPSFTLEEAIRAASKAWVATEDGARFVRDVANGEFLFGDAFAQVPSEYLETAGITNLTFVDPDETYSIRSDGVVFSEEA